MTTFVLSWKEREHINCFFLSVSAIVLAICKKVKKRKEGAQVPPPPMPKRPLLESNHCLAENGGYGRVEGISS